MRAVRWLKRQRRTDKLVVLAGILIGLGMVSGETASISDGWMVLFIPGIVALLFADPQDFEPNPTERSKS